MDDLKGIIHDVGKKPRSLVENGAVVEPAISGNHRNVVQVPVIVEYKTVNFKLQGQTLGGRDRSVIFAVRVSVGHCRISAVYWTFSFVS